MRSRRCPREEICCSCASTRDAELVIEVADTGSGIPAEIQHEIFKPYFSTKARGTGMGLALTEKLIGQHEGRIELKSSQARNDLCHRRSRSRPCRLTTVNHE